MLIYSQKCEIFWMKRNCFEKKMTKNSIKKYRSIFNVISRIIDTNILNKIIAENCKIINQTKKTKRTKEITKELITTNTQMMKRQMLNLIIWQVWKHRNMRVCRLKRYSTIRFEKAWYTILIVMILSLTISNDTWIK